MTKINSKKTSSTVQQATIIPSGVHPVPATVTRPPAGWTQPPRLGKKGARAVHGQAQITPELATELRANAAAFMEELGPKVPDPHQVAAAFDLAHGWGGAVEDSRAFFGYARVQKSAAWDHAFALLRLVVPGVKFAVLRDPTFTERFPVLSKMIAQNKRGGRKPKPKAKAVVAVAAPAAAPAAAAEPAAVAAPHADVAPAAALAKTA